MAFSINSSQADKSLSIGPDGLYRSGYSPAGMALPGPQIRYEAGCLSLLADEGYGDIDSGFDFLLRNDVGTCERGARGAFIVLEELLKAQVPSGHKTK